MIKKIMGLRLAFAGTPDLAATILETLIQDTHHMVSLVYTQPDRPAGRGKKIQQSPVKILARKYRLPVEQPESKTELDASQKLKEMDALIVVAYGMILPKSILVRPRLGCLNIHTSLLPRWRGPAPIQYAILEGDVETGISIMQMDSGLDTGDILLQKSCQIQLSDTSRSLEDRLAVIGAECIWTVLDMIRENAITPRKQNNNDATYSKKILKSSALIDWSQPAAVIERMIRAFNPAPVAYAEINKSIVRIWQAEILDKGSTDTASPGAITDYSASGLDINTGNGALRILKLQLPNKKVLDCRDFYNGNPHFCD